MIREIVYGLNYMYGVNNVIGIEVCNVIGSVLM